MEEMHVPSDQGTNHPLEVQSVRLTYLCELICGQFLPIPALCWYRKYYAGKPTMHRDYFN